MIQDLTEKKTEITFGYDSVVVRKFTNGIFGGVMLDLSRYTGQKVLAGQAVITDGKTYRPMPVNGETYGEMPDGFKLFGVVYRSSMVNMGVSVMTRGTVNKYRAPYDFTSLQERFREDNPFIIPASDVDEMEGYVRLEASDGVVYTSDGKEIWFRKK